MELENFFCSKVRMKILKLLFRLGQLNTSDLAQRVGGNYSSTLKHLVLMEKENIIEKRVSGRTRFFRFANSAKAQATMKVLEEWENT
jgi:predicted transcriptional regulator